MDQVCIDGLEVECIVGCGAPERIKTQRILLYVVLYFDVSLCGRTDALEHTVNYAALSKRVEMLQSLDQLVQMEAALAAQVQGLEEAAAAEAGGGQARISGSSWRSSCAIWSFSSSLRFFMRLSAS